LKKKFNLKVTIKFLQIRAACQACRNIKLGYLINEIKLHEKKNIFLNELKKMGINIFIANALCKYFNQFVDDYLSLPELSDDEIDKIENSSDAEIKSFINGSALHGFTKLQVDLIATKEMIIESQRISVMQIEQMLNGQKRTIV